MRDQAGEGPGAWAAGLRDASGRRIDYLRLSVTDRCNLRCRYCMPEEGVRPLTHDDVLRYEEIAAFLEVAAPAGIRRVRITGGEPLARRGLVRLVERLAAIPQIEDLSLTTNGTLLAPLARSLRAAGLRRVNVSLPSLDAAGFAWVARRGALAAALAGLEAALAAGLAPVKVNAVLVAGVSDDPAPYVELTRRLPVEVRFIEYMPVGGRLLPGRFVRAAELRRRLEPFGPFEPAAPAAAAGPSRESFRLPGAPGTLAVIAAVTESFCDRCNRLRLTADGKLRSCLLAEGEVDLKPALRPVPDPVALRDLLLRAVAAKPAGRPHALGNDGRPMGQIGG